MPNTRGGGRRQNPEKSRIRSSNCLYTPWHANILPRIIPGRSNRVRSNRRWLHDPTEQEHPTFRQNVYLEQPSNQSSAHSNSKQRSRPSLSMQARLQARTAASEHSAMVGCDKNGRHSRDVSIPESMKTPLQLTVPPTVRSQDRSD